MDVQTKRHKEWLKIEVELLLTVNRKSYMPRQLAQQQMTLFDFEWPFSGIARYLCDTQLSFLLSV